jgi:osmotically-inducible protein OsmY
MKDYRSSDRQVTSCPLEHRVLFGSCAGAAAKQAVKMKKLLLVLSCAVIFGCRTNESPEAQINDLEITTQLKSKLASDVGVSSVTNISVNSTNGVVTLSGQVDSAETRSKAEATAKAVPKVVRVVDNLQIAPKPQ